MRVRPLDFVLAVVAILAIGWSWWSLLRAEDGLLVERTMVGDMPTTIHRPATGSPGPAVVVAHGFAGSSQLMQAFAVTLARNGYVAVSFDFAGHGRSPVPLAGNIVREDGATRMLVAQTQEIAAFARRQGDGRLAMLGHSMASDIVVRAAIAEPDVTATVAVSMFSRALTATEPRDLLVIVGAWEGMLRQEALRAVGLATDGQAEPGVTYGDLAAGTARRAAFSPATEHVSVLFSRDTMAETMAWLDGAFGIQRPQPPYLDRRGPLLVLLFTGLVLLARPLSALLPVVAVPPTGGGRAWRRYWPALVVPALLTPPLALATPMHFLPVLVADYLAAHFLIYGILTVLCLLWLHRGEARGTAARISWPKLALAVAMVCLFGLLAVVWPLDRWFTSFVPSGSRVALIALMAVGTLAYFLADEWATRGPLAARFAYPAAKLAFSASLALAVALDLERLFFLVIIVPLIVLFFLVYGLFSRWTYAHTGHPFVAGIANALAFAWAIGVTFPLLAG